MTITNGYATLAEYKSWIAMRGLVGSVGIDAYDDTVIEKLIESVSRYIDRQTSKRFYLSASDEIRYYTTDDPYHCNIDDFGSITNVSVDYNGLRSYEALVVADYDTLPDNAALDGIPFSALAIVLLSTSSAYFPTTRRAVKVIGKIGWPITPKDINEATLSIVQSLNGTRSGQASQGKITVTAAGIVIRPEDVPAFAQKIIQQYRNMT